MSQIRLAHKCCFCEFFGFPKNWTKLRIQDKLDEAKVNLKMNLINLTLYILHYNNIHQYQSYLIKIIENIPFP